MAIAGLVACGGAGDDKGRRLLPISADYLVEARRSATADQQAILADGVVTFDEYEQAVLAAVACIEATGATVIGPDLRFQGKWYDYSAHTNAEGQPDAVRQCFATSAVIVNTWSLEIQPTEKEVQEARKALIQCLRERGLTLPDDITGDRLAGLTGSAVHKECSDRVSEEYGIPFFGG